MAIRTLNDDASIVFEADPNWTTGLGGAVMLNIQGSGAVDLREAVAPIEAAIGFDRLQRMRDYYRKVPRRIRESR